MKKLTYLIVAGAAGIAFASACGPVEDEPTTGDGDDGMGGIGGEGPGDGDGTGGGDGDGDGDDVTGGNGGMNQGPACDDEVVDEGDADPMCDAPDAPETAIEIVGSYIDEFDAPVEVTAEGIQLGGTLYSFSIVDNDTNYAVARNPSNDLFEPCAWSVFVWHKEGDDLFYCQAPSDAESECAALEADMPDSDDLLEGCNGIQWSSLIAE